MTPASPLRPRPWLRCALASALLAPSAPAVQSPTEAEPTAATVQRGPALDETLLEVDGVAVPFAQFARWLLDLQGDELQWRFMDRVVLRRAAEDLGVAPTAQDIVAATRAAIEERVALGYTGDRARYEAELAAAGSSPQRDFERRSVLVEELMTRSALARATRPAPGEPAHEAALAAAYRRRYGPDGRELAVRVIRLRPSVTPPAPDEDEAARRQRVDAGRREVEARLVALADRIRDGADVDALAREVSEDPDTRLQGGRMPAPFLRNGWPRAVIDALATLAPGEPSPPVFAHGYYNLFVLESAVAVPLERARAELERALQLTEPDEAECRAAVTRVLAAGVPSIVWHAPVPDAAFAAHSARLEAPLATYGEEVFTHADLALWIARERGHDFVRPFVRELRLARHAASAQVAPDPAAVEARAAERFAATLRQVYGGDRARMGRDLERRGSSEERLRAQIAREAWRDLAADGLLRAAREVTDEEVRALWEQRFGPLGKSYDARLLVRALQGRDAAEERERLAALAREAQRGADFSALVARWSDDAVGRVHGGRPQGDAPGRFKHEEAPGALVRALERLAPGETSPPLDLDETLVLVHLIAVTRVPLSDVADALRAELAARPSTSAERVGLLLSFDLDDACTYHAERLFGASRAAPK